MVTKVKYEEEKTSADDTSPKCFIKSTTGATFVKENTGNIKDYYKISSCIGRGKFQYTNILLHVCQKLSVDSSNGNSFFRI